MSPHWRRDKLFIPVLRVRPFSIKIHRSGARNGKKKRVDIPVILQYLLVSGRKLITGFCSIFESSPYRYNWKFKRSSPVGDCLRLPRTRAKIFSLLYRASTRDRRCQPVNTNVLMCNSVKPSKKPASQTTDTLLHTQTGTEKDKLGWLVARTSAYTIWFN